MTTSKEIVLIGGVVRGLNDVGSWTGETHIQKAAYLAKAVEEVPFDAEFVLYKHGPYSFDLSKSISHLKSRNILEAHVNPGYGPSFYLNDELWSALDRALGGFYQNYRDKVELICRAIDRKNVAELERIATAAFVSHEFPELAEQQMILKLQELKPHVSPEQAETAFRAVSDLVGPHA